MLSSCINHLKSFETNTINRKTLQSCLYWKQVRNQCLCKFFKANKKRSITSNIIELDDIVDQIHTSHIEMEYIYIFYYNCLYIAQQPMIVLRKASNEALESFVNCLTKESKGHISNIYHLGRIDCNLSRDGNKKIPMIQ